MNTQPKTSLIQLEIDGCIARVTLTRPDKYNALNVQMISELIEVFTWTAKNSVGVTGKLESEDGKPYFRVLVLSGEGKHFCAGADINMMRDAGANTPEENRRDSERLDSLFNGLWSHPCFTIGKIQGVALGGGAGLIACLDHVNASSVACHIPGLALATCTPAQTHAQVQRCPIYTDTPIQCLYKSLTLVHTYIYIYISCLIQAQSTMSMQCV